MEKKEFVRTACAMGICRKGQAELFVNSSGLDTFTEKDLVDLYHKANPEVMQVGVKTGGPLLDDNDRETVPVVDLRNIQKKRKINYEFVADCFTGNRQVYDREPTYIRDEKMRLVLNPRRLKGL